MVATTGARDCLASVNWICPCCPVIEGKQLSGSVLVCRCWRKKGVSTTGPAPTTRIPRPVLTPRQGSGQAPSGVGRPCRGASAGRWGWGYSQSLRWLNSLPPSRRQQQPTPLSRSALRALNALVLEHLPLADALASAAARRLFPLVEGDDLIQVAREALVRSAARY